MSKSGVQFGAPRHPNVIARIWDENYSATLNDLHRENYAFRVDAVDAGKTASISIAPYRRSVYLAASNHSKRRFNLPWAVKVTGGSNTNVAKVSDELVLVSGIPTPESQYESGRSGIIRPYADLLFRAGEIEITPIVCEGNEVYSRSAETFNLGEVVGLIIVEPAGKHPVWSPFEDGISLQAQ